MNSHGGARKGAGRKATGPKAVKVSLSLSRATVIALKGITAGKRSKFADLAIREKLAGS
jgi:hypothetical protein